MLQKIILLLSGLLALSAAMAQQTVTLSGTVSDSAGNKLSSVSVTLIKTANGAGLLFTRTDSMGNYSFNLPEKLQQEKLAVKVTAIDMLKAQKAISSFNNPLNFSLSPEPRILQEVKVKSKIYIVQKADTLSFNADLFRDSSDRVLGDLIRHIPGIEVDENGAIKYNGKYMNNFYIEGDDLLDGKYNIATDNIPSKDVDKVEVIEHNQHIKMLNGIVPSDQPALNIRLKDKSKLRWINNAELAGGTPSRYSSKINSMAFKPRIKAINEIKTNNTGNDLSNELLSHYSNNNGNPSELMNLDIGRPPGIDQRRYFFDKAWLANANDMYKLRSGTTLRLNAYYLHDIQPLNNNSNTVYYLPNGDTIGYTEQQESRLRINETQASLNINTNNDKKFFNETLSIDASQMRNAVAVNSNGQNLQQTLKTSIQNFSNTIGGVFMLHKKQVVQYNSYIGYYNDPQHYAILPGWQQELLNKGIDYRQTMQYTRIPTWYTNNNLSFILQNRYWTFNNTIGIQYKQQILKSDISLLQNDNSLSQAEGYRNHVDWKNLKAYVQPSIQYEKNRSRLNLYLPLSYNYIHYTDTLQDNADKLNTVLFLPYLNYRLSIGKEHELLLSYSYNKSLSAINQVYKGGIFSNYRNILSYQTPLIGGYIHNFSTDFSYKKSLRLFFWNIGLNYTTTHLNYLYASTVTNTLYRIEALPIANNSSTATMQGNISKYIFPLKTTVSGTIGLQQSEMQQMQNNILFKIKNRANNYSIGIAPKPVDWFRLDLNAGYNTATSASRAQGYEDQRTSQFKQTSAFTVYPLQQLSLQFSSEYYASYLNRQQLAHCLFLDAYVNYRLYHPDMELRLSCTNLMNERNFRIISASTNVIANREYQLQPRMVIVSAAFRF